mgnify:CR=1 FL=1|jgi:hypothetical protein|tara:strand:- start:259 stop:420 length:162 start_codon:yes stop_codon:yes gene_type:complete
MAKIKLTKDGKIIEREQADYDKNIKVWEFRGWKPVSNKPVEEKPKKPKKKKDD